MHHSTLSRSLILPLIFLALAALMLISGCATKKYTATAPQDDNVLNECVILLHGLGRSSQSMEGMQDYLTTQGYHTVSIDYPSTELEIETIARDYVPGALTLCQETEPEKIHFVSHSLGGIIIRFFLSNTRPLLLGRIVMLSPPNKGSQLVDAIGHWDLYQWIMGPAGQQLYTTGNSIPVRLGGVDYPVGIITGNKHAIFDTWFADIIPGTDDGKVSVENAQIEGMQDFLIVGESHPFIMESEYVQREAAHFLQHGRFSHKSHTN